MIGRYYFYMASISLLHIFAFASFMATGGSLDALAIALPINLLILIGINLAGAHQIFRPIRHYLSDQQNASEAFARIHRLPLLSSIWGAFLVLTLMSFAFFGISAPCPGCDLRTMAPFYVSMIILFCTFIGIFLFFLIDDYTAQLKAYIFSEHQSLIIPAHGRLLHKFIAAFIVVGVIPVSLSFLEFFAFTDARALMGVEPAQAFTFDLVASAFMGGASFFFIQRNLKRPVESLDHSMAQVAMGNLEATAPILTDDEIGRLAAGFNRMLSGLKERDFIRETFGKYVPASVAQSILENRGEFEPQHRLATILYTDIQGFTGICEALAPEQIVSLLNKYFSLLVEIIDRHEGVVNQFQGDALLVTFNVPVAVPDHAAQSVACALEIQTALASHDFGDGIEMVTRIGINTGNVFAGSVGAGDRLNYTVHGDAVNLAARLENLNKQYDTRVLISASTKEAVGDRFEFIPIGKIEIRGKLESVDVYSVMGPTPRSEETPSN